MLKSNPLISCAVVAAIAAAPSRAHATDITTYAHNQANGLNINVYISGSTSIDNSINVVLTNVQFGVCQRGTVNEYRDPYRIYDVHGQPIGGSPTETLWYCQAGSGVGVPSYMFVAIFKESTAGSVNGVQPLITVAKGGQSGLTFLSPTGPDVQNGTCGSPQSSGNGYTTYTYTGCGPSDFLQNVVPTGGISDVEGSLLRTIPGGGTLAAADIATYLVNLPGLDMIWGVAVTKNLYYALQSAEGQTSKCPTVNGTQHLDSPSCAPSLSRGQVAGLLNREIDSWKILGLNNPFGDNIVRICRSGAGAGATAAYEAYFLGARCGASSETTAAQDGSTVVESASVDGFLSCMRAFDQAGGLEISPYNGDYDTTYPPFTTAGNQWAIGITSTELTPGQLSAYGDTIRMVAVDGTLPTLENVVNGFYLFWDSDIWYRIKPGDANAPTGDSISVLNLLEQNLGYLTQPVWADGTYVNVWGDGGELAPASPNATGATYSSYPVNATEVEATAINLWTKASSGAINNCDTPVLWKGAAGLVSPPDTVLGTGNLNQGP